MLSKYPYIRSRKLLDSSKGQVCTLGFPGCNHDTETTVACHGNHDYMGKGGSIKATDWISVDGCSHCHDVLDGRLNINLSQDEKDWYFWRALVKTTNRRISEGLIRIEGA